MQALLGVRNINLLFPVVADGSRSLVDCVEAKKSRTDKILGTTAILGSFLGLHAVGFFLGSPELVESLYSAWVTAGSPTAVALGAAGAVGTTGAGGGIGSLLYRLPCIGGVHWQESKLFKSANTIRPNRYLANHSYSHSS